MKNSRDWVNVVYLSLTLLIAVTITPLYLYLNPVSPWIYVFTFIFCAATEMAITGGYHRLFSHRSYQASPLLKFLYVMIGTMALEGPVLQWASDHRQHHKAVDTDEDPHNINEGFFWAHVGWLIFKDPNKDPIRWETIPDLARDKLLMFQYKHYVILTTVLNVVFSGLAGWLCGDIWAGLLVVGVTRLVLTNHFTFLVNSLAHTSGSRPYSDKQTARDNLVVAILAFGEGYHNFHHVFASDYRNGIKWYHWDPTKWLIRGCSFLGMAKGLRVTQPTAILEARLRTEGTRLVNHGVCAEKVQQLRQRVEEAQRRWRSLKDEYRRVKTSMAQQSRDKLAAFKAELKIARLEFKFARRQWGVFRRTRGRAVPVLY